MPGNRQNLLDTTSGHLGAETTSGAATLQVVTDEGAWPAPLPFTAVLGESTDRREVVTVIDILGGAHTVLRGQLGTSPVAHPANESYVLGANRADLSRMLAHLEHLEAPQQIPNLVFWVKADSLIGLSEASVVSVWPDLSGHGRHAQQPVAGSRPTFRAAVLNSRPVVRFDGVDDIMATAAFNVELPQPVTHVAVMRIPAAGSFRLADGLTANHRHNTGFNGTGEMFLTSGGLDVLSPTQSYPLVAVLVAEFNGASTTIALNGTQVAAGDLGMSVTLDGVTLGARYDGVGPFAGDIAEYAVWSRLFTPVEKVTVVRAFGSKYGITVA